MVYGIHGNFGILGNIESATCTAIWMLRGSSRRLREHRAIQDVALFPVQLHAGSRHEFVPVQTLTEHGPNRECQDAQPLVRQADLAGPRRTDSAADQTGVGNRRTPYAVRRTPYAVRRTH